MTKDLGATVATAPGYDPFAGPQLQATVPSTESQREIWTAAQLGPEASLAFNESISLEMRGTLELSALRASFSDLVRRHESLRASFTADGTTFCVLEDAATPFDVVDLSGRPPEARAEQHQALLAREVETPFDLERGPLARVVVVRLAQDLHVVLFTAHHIVVDGWSWSVLVADWARLYGAHRRGAQADLPPADRFSDYARAQAERQGNAEWQATQAYWLKQFSGEIPILDLPSDRPRAAVRAFASRRLDFVVPAELVNAVKKVGAVSGASLFVTLLAAYKAWLHRLSGQTDVVVGVPAAGQAAAGAEGLVGHCVQTLPLRSRVDPQQPFRDLLKTVRASVLDGFEHQQLTFGELLHELPIRRDPSRPPLVTTFFNLDRPVPKSALAFDGLACELRGNPRHFETFDLFVNGVETDAGLVLECQYNSGLFDAATIERLLRHYRRLLASIAADPALPLARLAAWDDADAAAIAAWNDTQRAVSGSTVHALVEAQASRTPDAVAVVQGERSLSYRELLEEADRIAARLRAAGVGRGTLVGLLLERTPELVACVLGVLKAGAAYVPLDPAHPDQRLDFMVRDCEMPVLLTQSSLRERLTLGATRRLLVDERDEPSAPQPAPAIEPQAQPEDTAYVIYTSGSTGKPKGVLVSHANVVNLLESVRERPGMTADDVVMAITTLSFDIAVSEILLPLVVGARILLVRKDDAVDGARLMDLIREHGASFVDATPATWRLLIEAGWSGDPRVKAICTGEAMPSDLAAQLVTRVSSLWNGYGPTETTVWATFHEVTPPVSRIVIGRPVWNTQIHVLDGLGQRLPIGVAGELCIGGRGVAKGYWKRPELTAERFVPDPFANEPGARLYRTGDLGRWLADGTLECLGRIDFQVKVRGYRIELGEIEAALAAHASVTQAVVTTREQRAGDVRLVAYVVLRGGVSALDEAALRAHLAGLLPDYMLPQHFVALESLPLTPSGKVDRKALPAPVPQARDEAAYVAPRTATETLLAGLWEQALGVRRVGVHDDFFALGGHSLLAAQVLSRLNREHAIVLPFRSVFEAPTIERFAALVDGRSREERERAVTRIPRRAKPGPAPVSLMQERILLLEELDPERGLVHTVPSAFRLEGPLDASALAGALDDVVRRQESLRTTFRKDGSGYVQLVADSLQLELETHDLRDLEASQREPALRALLDRETRRGFDLERGPLFRAYLLRLHDEEHVLFTLRHNAIWDGWSFDVFRHELATFYEARLAGRAAALPELPIGYADFAAWHREWLGSAEIETQLAFWRKRLEGNPAPVELPTDRPRPAVRSYAGADEWLHVPRAEADLLAELGRELGATTFMVLLTAFGVLLQRYSGRNDVLIASPVRNRPRPEIEDLIGLFTNTLLLRNDIDPSLSFASLLKRVRATTLDAFSHQEAPYDLLAREAPPLRVIFSLQEARHRETALGPLRLNLPHVLPPAAAVDMNFWLVEMKDGLKGALNYSTELFDPSTIRGFLSHFRELLVAIREDPARPVGQLRLVSALERQQLVAQAAAAEPPAASLVGALSAWATQQPDRVALRLADGSSTTYAELLAEARGRAAWLAERGVRSGDRVALALEDGQQRLASLLSLLWLGAVAVPLDPRDPAPRLEARLASSGATWLWGETAAATLPASRVLPPRSAGTPPASGQGAPAEASGTAWVETAPAPSGGFVAFPVLAGAIAGRLDAASRGIGLVAGATLATLPGASTFVSLLGAVVGATLAVADEEDSEDGAALAAWLRTVGASALVAPAPAWRRLLAAGWSPGPGFVAVAVEPLPEDTARGLQERGVATFLAWGLEEAGGWCSLAPVEAGSTRPRLAALPGVVLEVLEPSLEPAPAGVPGQLHVGAFGRDRLYSSRERARRRDGGSIERLERGDGHVLVRAGRVELDEVKAGLAAHPAVADAAVLWYRETASDPRLVAYVVARPGTSATDTELRRHLKQTLPPEAVPRHFVSVPSLQRQPDGRLDARALPMPFARRAAARPPATAAERLLVELWQGALGLPRVEVTDNFFDLGGHSLLCLQVVSEVEARTGRQLKPRLLLLSTLEQVAAELAREPWTRP